MSLQKLLCEPLSWPQDEWNKRTREFMLLNRIFPVSEIDHWKEKGVTIARCCMWRSSPIKLRFDVSRGPKHGSVEVYATPDSCSVRVGNQDLNGSAPKNIEELAKLIRTMAAAI